MRRMCDTISSYTCVAIFFMRSSSASIASMCSCLAIRLWSSTSTAYSAETRGWEAKGGAGCAEGGAIARERYRGRCGGECGGRATGRRAPWRERVASLLHVEANLVHGGALVAHADVVLAGGGRRHRKVAHGVLVLEEHLPRGRTDLRVALVISARRRPVSGEQTSNRDRLRDAALVRGLELEGHTVARADVECKGEAREAEAEARHRGGANFGD